MNSKRILYVCASLAMTLMLTACKSDKLSVPAYAHPSQPPYLYLEASKPVPTLRGDYMPKVNEKWVSPAVLEEKDQTINELTRALERQGVKPFLPK